MRTEIFVLDEEPVLSECDLISIYIQQLAAENGITSVEEVKMLIETHNLDWKSMINEATGQAIPEEYSFDDVLAHLLKACPDLAQLLAWTCTNSIIEPRHKVKYISPHIFIQYF